jgi:hypothetical protein
MNERTEQIVMRVIVWTGLFIVGFVVIVQVFNLIPKA